MPWLILGLLQVLANLTDTMEVSQWGWPWMGHWVTYFVILTILTGGTGTT